MVEVAWTDSALCWLHEIHDYIAQLAEFPESGQRLELRDAANVRQILYGHYRIAYRLPREDLIEIVGVYHGALDIARRLRTDLQGEE